ncbi:hypothetical protein AB0D49_39030 [Streptomyces sp. NPDC048290]|uniref:hypothetical protein n=1 Tax=Streptomyces sp. NPDC048290 TaxID=3155811 RepID=UPI00342C2753
MTHAEAGERRDGTPGRALRLLPWVSPEGKPSYLIGGVPGGRVSRLADAAEEIQLAIGALLVGHAEELLPDAPASDVRFLAERLTEALRDALRIAESRGCRTAP